MLVNATDSLDAILKNVRHEVHRGALDHKHPFRYITLTTHGKVPTSRYVVLRKVTEDFNLLVYTDIRSEKVEHIAINPTVQLLCYHPQKSVQVRIYGRASISHLNELADEHWQNVQGNARRAYNTVQAPGTAIDNPNEGQKWNDELSADNFGVIQIEPNEIEVLQLNKTEHFRVLFTYSDQWNGTWLVP